MSEILTKAGHDVLLDERELELELNLVNTKC